MDFYVQNIMHLSNFFWHYCTVTKVIAMMVTICLQIFYFMATPSSLMSSQ